jgi:hypothetical protein
MAKRAPQFLLAVLFFVAVIMLDEAGAGAAEKSREADDTESDAGGADGRVESGSEPSGADKNLELGSGDVKKGFRFESEAFASGAEIPEEHTCDGADRSPPFRWSGAPEGTKAFAIILEDPDASGGKFIHWVVYNIPDAARALDSAVIAEDDLGDGTHQGVNDFGKIGYRGPCPPEGAKHDYVFRLYALSGPVEVEPGAKHAALVEGMKGKILAEAEWRGHYRRGGTKAEKSR